MVLLIGKTLNIEFLSRPENPCKKLALEKKEDKFMKEGKGRATRMAVLLPLIIGLGMFLSGLPAQVLSGDTNITPKNACLNGVKLPLAKIERAIISRLIVP